MARLLGARKAQSHGRRHRVGLREGITESRTRERGSQKEDERGWKESKEGGSTIGVAERDSRRMDGMT